MRSAGSLSTDLASTTMQVALIFASYSLLLGSLLPEYVSTNHTPYISLPEDKGSRCMIGDESCNNIINELQSRMTSFLNEQRHRVATGIYEPIPSATNMLKLEDDHSLRSKAQRYAEACIQNYGYPNRCPLPGETETEGEVSISVKRHSAKSNVDPPSRVAQAIMQWGTFPMQDTSQFVKSFEPTQTEKRFLDFAKMIHTRVWKVGCGVADFFISEDEYEEMVVCFYGPPKLRNGNELYSIGSQACSNCPRGTSCLIEGQFRNTLCKVNEGSFPIFENYPAFPQYTTPSIPKEPLVINRDQKSNSEVAKSGNRIWECYLRSYTEECKVERSCSPHWTIDTSGGFKYIKVSGTCITASIFLQEIHLSGPSCFMFEYMKTGNQVGSLQTTVIAFASQVSGADIYGTTASQNLDKDEWDEITLDIPWSEVEVQVGVIVRSRSTSNDEQQVIKVKDFEIFTGSCADNT